MAYPDDVFNRDELGFTPTESAQTRISRYPEMVLGGGMPMEERNALSSFTPEQEQQTRISRFAGQALDAPAVPAAASMMARRPLVLPVESTPAERMATRREMSLSANPTAPENRRELRRRAEEAAAEKRKQAQVQEQEFEFQKRIGPAAIQAQARRDVEAERSQTRLAVEAERAQTRRDIAELGAKAALERIAAKGELDIGLLNLKTKNDIERDLERGKIDEGLMKAKAAMDVENELKVLREREGLSNAAALERTRMVVEQRKEEARSRNDFKAFELAMTYENYLRENALAEKGDKRPFGERMPAAREATEESARRMQTTVEKAKFVPTTIRRPDGTTYQPTPHEEYNLITQKLKSMGDRLNAADIRILKERQKRAWQAVASEEGLD